MGNAATSPARGGGGRAAVGGAHGSVALSPLRHGPGGPRHLPRFAVEEKAARLIHDGYGLTGDEVDLMFAAMRDVFRDVMADDWTGETEADWTKLLAEPTTIRAEA